ncbi:hypothetical protein ACVLD2_001888 [Paenibacillus sp. PvR052]
MTSLETPVTGRRRIGIQVYWTLIIAYPEQGPPAHVQPSAQGSIRTTAAHRFTPSTGSLKSLLPPTCSHHRLLDVIVPNRLSAVNLHS